MHDIVCISDKLYSLANYLISVPWTPVNKTHIGGNYLNTAHSLSYTIPSIIPSTAREVLVYSSANCGWSSINMAVDITYYVEVNGIRYEHFLHTHAYRQDAVNTNSDNMWFPMPPNRIVHVEAPLAIPDYCNTVTSVIGYR